jgi:hypothetical protein
MLVGDNVFTEASGLHGFNLVKSGLGASAWWKLWW